MILSAHDLSASSAVAAVCAFPSAAANIGRAGAAGAARRAVLRSRRCCVPLLLFDKRLKKDVDPHRSDSVHFIICVFCPFLIAFLSFYRKQISEIFQTTPRTALCGTRCSFCHPVFMTLLCCLRFLFPYVSLYGVLMPERSGDLRTTVPPREKTHVSHTCLRRSHRGREYCCLRGRTLTRRRCYTRPEPGI